MSLTLSALLGANEPHFSLSLRQLERAGGRPSADVRLASEVVRGAKTKLRELGLDPENTTGEELYAALRQRIEADDKRLSQTLRTKFGSSGDEDALTHIAKALKQLKLPKKCFALKNAKAKSILRKNPPKRVMKQLGYRSLESMLKHETAASLVALGWLVEAAAWRHGVMGSYKKLKPTDFEERDMEVIYANTKRWQKLADTLVLANRHNILIVKELGAVVMMPLPAKQPPVMTITSLALVLHAMNEIRAASTYLKLCQVKADFGSNLQTVVTGEPYLEARLLDRPVSWQVVQRYYARFSHALKAEVFEPHIQAEDLAWHSVEKVLAHLEPALAFWQHTASLGLLHNHEAVSFNIVDTALNACNRLPYSHRLVHYFRRSLMSELSLRYLKHDTIERMVVSELQQELAYEPNLN